MLTSSPAPSAFSQTIAADLLAAGSLMEAMQDWLVAAGVSEKESMQLVLVVDELLTNTITHGYPAAVVQHTTTTTNAATAGCITVTAEVTTLVNPALPGAVDKAVVLCLTDDALTFDPLSLPLPDVALGMDERSIGGLGVYFVRQLVDEITYCCGASIKPDTTANTCADTCADTCAELGPFAPKTCTPSNQLRIVKRVKTPLAEPCP